MKISQVYCNATSLVASKFLEFALEKFPFKVESIQVDGGTEFIGEFEKKAAAINLPLLALPPRSPKYNGGVERSNRIVREDSMPFIQMMSLLSMNSGIHLGGL